jgi:AcrR family transcriptional regulator
MTIERGGARDRILDLTRRLLDEGGLGAVKARAIAGEAGISVGSLYNIVGPLDKILETVFSALLDELAAAGADAIARLDGAVELRAAQQDTIGRARLAMLALSRAYLEFVGRYDRRWDALLTFNRSRPAGRADPHYLRKQDALFDFVGTIIDGTPLAASQPEKRIAARMLWSGVHGIIMMGYIGQANAETEAGTWRQVELFVDLVCDGIRRRG